MGRWSCVTANELQAEDAGAKHTNTNSNAEIMCWRRSTRWISCSTDFKAVLSRVKVKLLVQICCWHLLTAAMSVGYKLNSSRNVDTSMVLQDRHNPIGHTLLRVKYSIDKERNRYFSQDSACHCPSHPNPPVQQIGNYTLADLTNLHKKHKHKLTKHILL